MKGFKFLWDLDSSRQSSIIPAKQMKWFIFHQN